MSFETDEIYEVQQMMPLRKADLFFVSVFEEAQLDSKRSAEIANGKETKTMSL